MKREAWLVFLRHIGAVIRQDPTYATACVEFPWVVSRYYDDDRIVEESLETMTKWVDYLGSQEDEDGIVSFGLFGDWCPPMHANPVDTPFEITSTWYYCHDALMVSRMAARIGKADVARKNTVKWQIK